MWLRLGLPICTQAVAGRRPPGTFRTTSDGLALNETSLAQQQTEGSASRIGGGLAERGEQLPEAYFCQVRFLWRCARSFLRRLCLLIFAFLRFFNEPIMSMRPSPTVSNSGAKPRIFNWRLNVGETCSATRVGHGHLRVKMGKGWPGRVARFYPVAEMPPNSSYLSDRAAEGLPSLAGIVDFPHHAHPVGKALRLEEIAVGP